VNGAAGRRVPLSRRELEGVAALEREDRLNEPFTECRLADDERPVVVLQRAGDDLRCGRRGLVGEHDERHRRLDRRLLRTSDVVTRVAAADAHDLLPFAQEETAHRERLLDDTAAVLAQIEDQAARTRAPQLLDCLAHLVRRVLVERLKRDVSDALLDDHRVRDGGDANDAAHES
jgi:hypothetical protein